MQALQSALERKGAESLVARDRAGALKIMGHFEFDAVLINAKHRDLIGLVPDLGGIPYLLFAASEAPDGIVAALGERLGHE